MSVLDFTEIESGDAFEALVYDLLAKIEGVRSISKSGVGTDDGVDISLEVEVRDPFTPPTIKKMVVQCKHHAKSRKAVSATEHHINPLNTLRKADIYLLVTSYHVAVSTQKVIEAIHKDEKYRGERAAYWDVYELEKRLLRSDNRDIVQRYFPRSAAEIERREAAALLTARTARDTVEMLRAAADTPAGSFTKEEAMPASATRLASARPITPPPNPTAYIVSSIENRDVLAEEKLRRDAREAGIDLSFSADILVDWLGSVSDAFQFSDTISKFDAVFAIVRTIDSRSPKIWMEIQKAHQSGKLKLVLLEEGAYSSVRLRRYPLLILEKSLSGNLEKLYKTFRENRHEWGTDEQWFWLAVNVIASLSPVTAPRRVATEAR